MMQPYMAGWAAVNNNNVTLNNSTHCDDIYTASYTCKSEQTPRTHFNIYIYSKENIMMAASCYAWFSKLNKQDLS